MTKSSRQLLPFDCGTNPTPPAMEQNKALNRINSKGHSSKIVIETGNHKE